MSVGAADEPLPRGGGADGEAVAFEERARRLAESHLAASPGRGDPRLLAAPGRLLALLADAERRLRGDSEDPVRARTAEWVLDNAHVVRAAVREVRDGLPADFYRELPLLETRPRVRVLALELVGAERPIDLDRIERFLAVYQQTAPLTIGELWALPLMLRLAVVETLLDAVWSLLGEGRPGAAAAPPVDRVVAACVSGLRTLAAADWAEFFETNSVVENALRRDPAGVYPQMDFASRDRYRKEVERLARGSGRSEIAVAEAALATARRAAGPGLVGREHASDPASHVGTALVGPAARELEAALGYRPRPAERLRRTALAHPTAAYLGPVALLAAALSAVVALLAAGAGAGPGAVVLAVVLALVPAVGAAVALVNRVVTLALPPRVLPRLELTDGIPAELATVVAVPALLAGEDDARELAARLELHYLRNPDRALVFALLSDFGDARERERPEDARLLAAARTEIEALNARYPGAGGFLLLHRERRFNPAERVWMGWERKRGKLEELNRLIVSGDRGTYIELAGPVEALRSARYVITLDADTDLPRDGARALLGILAHPLNRAELDERGRVKAGYGILQPRTEVSAAAAGRSPFTRLLAGAGGLDPYALAVSDAYQDLFGEGIFIGKGIYDVHAFAAALDGRVPDNTLLSHDLFEGLFARAALVSDVVVVEDFPPNYLARVARSHRWMRGDWQLLPWLGRRVPEAGGRRAPNPLAAIDRWKIVDNLRRSLHAPGALGLLVAGWLLLPGSPAAWTAAALLLGGVAHLIELLGVADGVGRRSPGRLAADARDVLARWALDVVFLPFEALVALDAVVATLVRLLVTRRHLLQWRPAAHAAALFGERLTARTSWTGMVAAVVAALGLGLLVAAFRPGALPAAAPLLLAWLLSPQLAVWISRPFPTSRPRLPAPELARLRLLARRTWLFFETFMGPEDNWLPPDNYQESPVGIVGHRTSPTNIGLGLLSAVAAHDLGYLGLLDLAARLDATLSTVERLERHRGHVLNWFDTRTLMPLPPRYVSTVDSGNLGACLLAVASACDGMPRARLLSLAAGEGLSDTVGLLEEAARELREGGAAPAAAGLVGLLAGVRDAARAAGRDERAWRVTLAELEGERGAALDAGVRALVEAGGGELSAERLRTLRQLAGRVRAHVAAGVREVDALMPWLAMLTREPEEIAAAPPESAAGAARRRLDVALSPGLTLAELPAACAAGRDALATLLQSLAPGSGEERAWCEELEQALASAARSATGLLEALAALADRARALFAEIDFGFLYDRARHLFFIGYNVDAGRPDANYYDLLASEARLASLLAIAKGDVPQRHWLQLARPLTSVDGRRVLLSWSGTMFEYLMPLLLLRSFPGTLLHESVLGAVERHVEHGRENGVPWGVSESAYARVDAGMLYQYRAFGVPGLGFKRGLADDLVIAPYASALALPLRPTAVLANLARVEALGGVGSYGCYEAIDFTRRRLGLGETHTVVRAWMAHHQGMILLSLVNYLCDDVMVERLHAEPQVASVELLLQERPALDAPLERPHEAELSAAPAPPPAVAFDPWRVSAAGRLPSAHVLSNGRYGVLLTATGAGASSWRDVALTRFRPDPTLEDSGWWVYVEDLESDEVLAATAQPLGAVAGCEVEMAAHAVRFRRRVGDLSLELEVTVPPDDDLEVRRLTVTNHSRRPRRLRVTSFAEVVLGDGAADARHPAFAKLFVESEWVAEASALVFRRRPRSAHEEPILLAHVLLAERPGGSPSWEGDRARFLGRGGTARDPAGLARRGGLSGTVGATLDPAACLAQEIEVGPLGTTRLAVLSAASRSRAELLALVARYRSFRAADRAFERARAASEHALRALGLDSERLARLERLLGPLLLPHAALRERPQVLAANRKGQTGLWPYGISGDHPILLVRVESLEHLPLVHELVQAHAFWRQRHVAIDLVIENRQATDYGQEMASRLHRLIVRRDAEAWLGRRGGIFIVSADQMPDEDRVLLGAAARVVLDGGRGTLAEQLRIVDEPGAPELPDLLPTSSGAETAGPRLERPRALLLDNGIGGFAPDGREYVIHLEAGVATPAPWVNVIANPGFGFVVSESGGGFTWAGNSGENRLTPWSNDPVGDRPGEVVYLRDEETAEVWTPTPQPAPAGGAYRVRHGFGASVFEHASHALEQRLLVLAAADDPVKLIELSLDNRSPRPRRLTVTLLAEWVLGAGRSHAAHVTVEYDEAIQALLARNPFAPELPGHVAFAAASAPLHGLSADREEVLGRLGSYRRPAGLRRIGLSGRAVPGSDPCAALQVHVDLPPGGGQTVHFLLGQAPDRESAVALIGRYRQAGAVAAAREAVGARWEAILGAVRVRTPDPALDLMLGGWLLYQALSCRVWGRSALYQSSGAYGFRDQLQDVMALTIAAPALAREQVLRAAGKQFEAGDVLHWWHPPSGKGVRTRFADDLLWLPLVAAHYVEATGDDAVLDEPAPLLAAPELGPGEEERYGHFAEAGVASLYEHCRRALERGFRLGPHELPLMGGGDWNDGMNRVGVGGRGESVWMAWFYGAVAERFAAVAERRGEQAYAEELRARARALAAAAERHAWDGSWYLRAFYDDGTPLGSAAASECRIDAIAQSWAVLSGLADGPRAARAMASVREHLVRREEGLVLLLTPPFDRTTHDPGYIKGYLPGVRENGAQYTHAAIWTAWAFAQLGDGDTAAELLAILNPARHADSPAGAARYVVEPYVVAADVYGVRPHTGRGGWTWYTGSAAWLYRLGLEGVLGLRRQGDGLLIDPCIPRAWPGFEAELRWGAARYRVKVSNPDGVNRGVAAIRLDGRELEAKRVPLVDDGCEHTVDVLLGQLSGGS